MIDSMTEKYYVNSNGKLYIKQEASGWITWGWHMYYDEQFRMCAKSPSDPNMEEITEEEFRTLLFAEKL